MNKIEALRYLEDRWDDAVARELDDLELLRYRSNLLGSDLRITNFGGGNTSSKLSQPDPLDGSSQEVLWVKALRAQGDDDGAERRANDFRRHFPSSLQQGALDKPGGSR